MLSNYSIMLFFLAVVLLFTLAVIFAFYMYIGKKAKEVLKKERNDFQRQAEELNLRIEALPGGLFQYSVEADEQFVFVSRNMLNLLGYTEQEFVSKFDNRFSNMIYVLDRERILREIDEQISHNDFDSCTYRIETKDGSLIWVHDVGHIVTDSAGKRWFYVVIVDITKQKFLENELLEKNKENSVVVQQSGKSVARFDIKTETLYNLGFTEDVFNVPRVIENAPKLLTETGILLPDSTDSFFSALESVKNGTGTGSCDMHLMIKTGEARWFHVDYTQIPDSDMQPKFCILSFYDITEQLEKEMAYEKLHNEMSALISESDAYYEVNLSTDTVEKQRINNPAMQNFSRGAVSLSQLSDSFIKHFVQNQSHKPFRDFLSLKLLAARYLSGTYQDDLAFPGGPEGNEIWYKLIIQMVRYPRSEHIKAFITIKNIDQEYRKKIEEEIVSSTDILTGLLNRNAFEKRITEQLARMGSSDFAALFIFDLDNFKLLNDTEGHQVGDDALHQVSTTVKKMFRENDLVGRLGGDELIAFMSTGASRKIVESKAQMLVSALACSIGSIALTTSVGAVAFSGEGHTFQELYKAADDELYRAKRFGKNNYSFACLQKKATETGSPGYSYANDGKQIENILYSESDELTGLLNMKGFYRQARELIIGENDTSFFIIRIDLDDFKMFNDMMGMDKGDRLLKDIAAFIVLLVKEDGLCARLTNDHFACLLPVAKIKPETMYQKLSEFLLGYPASIHLNCRIGVYMVENPELDINVMCDRALLALKSAKGSYITHIAFYDQRLRDESFKKQEITAEMSSALKENQYAVYFQPQYNYSTNKMIGAEALVRWNHPKKGLLPPNDFIPLFESNGFITTLDKYVWRKCCEYLSAWIKAGLSVVPVSINISRIDVFSTDLEKTLTSLIKEYQIPISLLQLEITESAYMDNPGQLIKTVKGLRSAGFTVAMDDFGSGYSSLNMLKEIPVDILKLDTRFLVSNNRNGNIILDSILRMAHWLNLSVLAEGVEDKESADYLKSINCLDMQGYYFCRPLKKEDFEKLLSESIVECKETGSGNQHQISFDQIETDMTQEIWGCCLLEYSNDVAEMIRANDAFFEILGISRADYTGRMSHVLDDFVGENRSRFVQMLDFVVHTKDSAQCTVDAQVTGGTVVRVHCNAQQISKIGSRYLIRVFINRSAEADTNFT